MMLLMSDGSENMPQMQEYLRIRTVSTSWIRFTSPCG